MKCKYIFPILAAIGLSLSASSCQKAPELSIAGPTSIDLGADGGYVTITFTANRDWSISWFESWITVSPSSGAASDEPISVTVRCNSNMTYDDRVTIVTLAAEDLTQTITVRQAQNDALFVKDSMFGMPYSGGEMEVKVEANVSIDVKPGVDWIHYVGTKALNSSTIVLSIDENKGFSTREGKVEIAQKGDLLSHTISVFQAGRIPVKSITLDYSELQLMEGTSKTLVATVKPGNASDNTVTWSSSNTDVAEVDSDGKVSAVTQGTATIKVEANDGSGIYASCSVTVVNTFFISAVDLGLSVKWADANLEADAPEGYGDYFAWGETETKSDYSWSTYQFGTSSSGPFSKYNTNSSNGTVDNKTVLDAEDDVAHVKLGGNWRMPTSNEMDELISTRKDPRYKWEWKSLNGHDGWSVTYLVNNNTIFLPAAGERDGTSLFSVGSYGYYWSSCLNAGYPGYAHTLVIRSDYVNRGDYGGRFEGLSIRPVTK